MSEQTPSVGRIVHVANDEGTTCAAIITEVHGDTCINVTRFNPDGTTEGITSLVKVHTPPKDNIDWNWPPKA